MSRRALIMATGRYEDAQLTTLHAPAVDAKGLREVLENPGIGAFEVDACLDFARSAWWDRIGDFFLDASRDDLLLLYVTGHAVKDQDGALYFAASDTQAAKLFSTGIAARYIQEAAQKSRSRQVVMVLDTCFSGALDRSSHCTSRRILGVKDVRFGARYLNSNAFRTPSEDMDGLKLATLYTLQDSLARDTQQLRRIA